MTEELSRKELERKISRLEQKVSEQQDIISTLEKQSEQFRQVVEHIREDFFIKDIETGNYIYLSPSFEDTFGVKRELILSDSMFIFNNLVVPEDRERVISAIERHENEMEYFSQEYRIIRPDGELKWIRTRAFPVFDSTGKPVRFVGITEDITERKRAESVNNTQAEVTRNMAEGAYIIGLNDGIIRWTSRKFEEMFGYEPGEMTGKHVSIVNAPAELTPEETAAEIMEVLHRTGEWHGEVNNIKKDGTLFWCDASVSTFTHSDYGDVLLAVHTDITERKQAEKALLDSEKKNRQLLKSLHEGIWQIDEQATTVYVNQPMAEMLGYTPEEMIGRHLFDFMDEKMIEEATRRLHQRQEGVKENHEFEFIKKDGTKVYIRLAASPILDDEDRYVGAIAGVFDITDRRRMEEKLRESHKDLNHAQAVAQTGSWRLDVRSNELLWSDETYRIFGIPKGTPMTYETFVSCIHPDDREYVDNKWQAALSGEEYDIEHRIIANGAVRWVNENAELEFTPDGTLAGGFGTVRDITERKRVERELRESEEKYRRLVESLEREYIIYSHDIQGMFTYLSPSIINVLGYTQVEFMGHYAEYMTDNPINETAQEYTNAALRGEAQEPYEVEFWHKNGNLVSLRVTEVPVFDDNGNVLGVEGVVQDITERKQAEDNLRESEEKLRLIYESVPEGIIVLDLDGKILDTNDVLVHMRGCDDKKEIIGTNCFELFADRDRDRVIEVRQDLVRTGSSAAHRYAFVKKDGSEFPVAFSAAVIRDAAGQPVEIVAIGVDMTQQQKMQDQLVMAERLASIGQLAAGIAHEINNPLTGVIGISRLLQDKDLPKTVKEDIDVIESEAKRAANIVKGLLIFAQDKGTEKVLLDINGIIQEVLQLRSYEQEEHHIELETQFASGLPYVSAGGAQMKQVFMSIIINAEQAMFEAYGKGRLRITTEKTGDMVRVSIDDDGPGISPENMKMLFTPFFTTKEVGKGTGLDLSICHGIITEHGGRLYAKSEPGKGANFIIELPVKAPGSGKE